MRAQRSFKMLVLSLLTATLFGGGCFFLGTDDGGFFITDKIVSG